MPPNKMCTGGLVDLPLLLKICCDVPNFLSTSSYTRFFNPLNPFHEAPVFDRADRNPTRKLIDPAADVESIGLYFYLMRCHVIDFILSAFPPSIIEKFSADRLDPSYKETKLFNLIDFFLVSQILAAPPIFVGKNDPLFQRLMSFGFTDSDLSPNKKLTE